MWTIVDISKDLSNPTRLTRLSVVFQLPLLVTGAKLAPVSMVLKNLLVHIMTQVTKQNDLLTTQLLGEGSANYGETFNIYIYTHTHSPILLNHTQTNIAIQGMSHVSQQNHVEIASLWPCGEKNNPPTHAHQRTKRTAYPPKASLPPRVDPGRLSPPLKPPTKVYPLHLGFWKESGS